MKKFFVVALCALAFAGFESCKPKVPQVAAAAVEHAKMLKDGNYDLLVEQFHFAPVVPVEQVAAEKETYKQAYKEQVHPVIAAKGGIKKSKVVSQAVAADGKSATVVMNHEYGNGQAEDVNYDFVNVDNAWKVADGNLREVWRTKTPEGAPLEIKLKESPHKDAVKVYVDGEHDFVKEIHDPGKEVVKVREGDTRDVSKVVEHKDGTIVEKEIHNGHREVTRTKPE
jgi:hypothetical protein